MGTDPTALADHYWYHGIQEGRLPYHGAKDVSAATVIALVNKYRSKNGLAVLKVDPNLEKTAQQRARELADNQYFAHTRPSNGAKWESILGSKRYLYSTIGENLGRQQTSAENVVNAWKMSPGHNAVMLNQDFSLIGVGVAKDTTGSFYFVLYGASPR